MKPIVHDDHCAKQQAETRNAPPRAANVFAAKAAAFMLSFSYACSALTPAQEPAAPARTARISSQEGTVGQWRFRRLDSGYEFNSELGTSIFIGNSMLIIRRPSLSSGGSLERSFPMDGINLDAVGASSQNGPLILTFPTISGKMMEFTVPPGGENPDVRTFVRAR